MNCLAAHVQCGDAGRCGHNQGFLGVAHKFLQQGGLAEGIARGIADELGIEPITKSSQYPGARITVILGDDFTQK